MEKDKAASDDSADYHGSGIAKRECLKNGRMGENVTTIDNAIKELLDAVKQSKEYVEYRRQLEKINMQPDLRRQVDTFRNENFELHNSVPDDQLLWKMEEFEQKYSTFRENPLVDSFLTAELAFVRLMQDVNLKITEGLQFE